MLDLILMILAAAMGGGEPGQTAVAQTGSQPVEEAAQPAESGGDGGLLSGLNDGAATEGLGEEEGFVAEAQIATGKFTTATEVKPIMAATQNSWVAVREFDGKDILYVTHIWGWRCGMHQMKIAINGGPMEIWPLPDCHENTNAPNAMLETDGLPYEQYPLGFIQSISVELLYDDMSEGSADFVRSDVLMPG